MNAIERHIGRPLTVHEAAIVEACGPALQGLAFICIEEGVSLKAAARLAKFMGGMFEIAAHSAAKLAADTVTMERLAPGSVVDDDPNTPKH